MVHWNRWDYTRRVDLLRIICTWEEYEYEDLERFTSAVLPHVRNCADALTVDKRLRVYPDTKPSMNRKVQQLLRQRDSAFRSKDKDLYNIARANLNRGIKEAKAEYKGKIKDCFRSNDSRRVWQGVQHVTNFRLSADGDKPELVEELNSFYARFGVGPTGGSQVTTPTSTSRQQPHRTRGKTLKLKAQS